MRLRELGRARGVPEQHRGAGQHGTGGRPVHVEQLPFPVRDRVFD